LNGRILRSRTVPGVEQEIYALLTVYQALIRTAGDLTTAHPEVSPQRVSFTVLLQAAADQIVTAGGIAPTGPVMLVGAIGRAALARLIPQERRWRLKARMRKRHSKYPFTRNRHPRATQRYTLHTQVIKDGVLDNATAP
jgi:thiamine monophosphate kinase